MLQNLRTRAWSEEGFTLIELLVVILIIGILAAIALPTFLGQSNNAKDSSAKSDVRNAVSLMEACLVESAGATTCAGDPGVLITGVSTTAAADPGETYSVSKASASGATFTITKPAAGGFIRCRLAAPCAGVSTW